MRVDDGAGAAAQHGTAQIIGGGREAAAGAASAERAGGVVRGGKRDGWEGDGDTEAGEGAERTDLGEWEPEVVRETTNKKESKNE